MNKKMYVNQSTLLAGMTLKDTQQKENNSMAFHVCETEAAVIENRQALADTLSILLDQFVCVIQTNRSILYEVTTQVIGRVAYKIETEIKNTDAVYTYEPNVLLCTFTADCVPVLFYHETTGVIGAIHSGWQGTVMEITKQLFTYLIDVEQHDPEGFHVYIGM